MRGKMLMLQRTGLLVGMRGKSLMLQSAHRKLLMFPGTASPVGELLLCAAALRSRGIDSIGHLVDKPLLCAAALRSHGIYGGGYLCLAVKDEAANARRLAEIREALGYAGRCRCFRA